MKPENFICSDALRDLIAQTVRATSAYQTLAAKRHYKKNTFDAQTIEWIGRREGDFEKEVTASLRKRLWDDRASLSPALQQEIEQLNQHMVGVATGYGCPAVFIGNLPQGVDGFLTQMGLARLAGNLRHAALSVVSVTQELERLGDHQKQHMHRDVTALTALCGMQVGQVGLATRFIDSEELIDAVTRQYQLITRGIALEEPLDKAVRQEVIGLLQQRHPAGPGFMENPAILAPDPAHVPGQKWPKPYHFISDFTSLRHYDTQSPFDRAIQSANAMLKKGDGPVIGPGEMVLFNDRFVLHAPGQYREDPRRQEGQWRCVVALDNRGSPVDEQGRVILRSDMSDRPRGR